MQEPTTITSALLEGCAAIVNPLLAIVPVVVLVLRVDASCVPNGLVLVSESGAAAAAAAALPAATGGQAATRATNAITLVLDCRRRTKAKMMTPCVAEGLLWRSRCISIPLKHVSTTAAQHATHQLMLKNGFDNPAKAFPVRGGVSYRVCSRAVGAVLVGNRIVRRLYRCCLPSALLLPTLLEQGPSFEGCAVYKKGSVGRCWVK